MDEIEKIRLKFDIDKKIDLNFDNKNKLKVLMLKGDDGFDPYIISARSGKTTTVTVTDYYGTQSFDILDGVDPTVNVERTGNKTTLTITDVNGTRTTDIYDGIDLTGGVPTDGVIGWDNTDISYTCDGTESGDYYLTYNNVDYFFTMPTIDAGDTLLFNTVNLTLKLNGTTISTSSSGTGTELTFVEYIPNGYEETNPIPAVSNTYSTSTTDAYSCNYVNSNLPTIHDSYSTSTTDPYSANYVNNIASVKYSTTEQVIGTWITGKPLYRKVIEFGALPDSTTKNVAHNISNLGKVVSMIGFANSNLGGGIPIPHAVSSNPVYMYISTTNVSVTTSNDRTAYNDTYIILEYTKSTD